MDRLDQLVATWAEWIVGASWQLAVLVAIVATITTAVPRLPSKWRYGLWLLVLVKVFVPPSWSPAVGIGRWGIGPALAAVGANPDSLSPGFAVPRLPRDDEIESNNRHAQGRAAAIARPGFYPMLWIVGGLAFWSLVGWRCWRVARLVRGADVIDEGPLRVAYERAGLELGLADLPPLLRSSTAGVPFLWGAWRPRIVLPDRLSGQLGAEAFQAVLMHELAHWRHRDTWTGWLQVCGQSLFWFHAPLWWASRQLRHERECLCDQAVLETGAISPESYSEAIFRVLASARGRSTAAGGLVGVFERGTLLHNRLEEIMNYRTTRRTSDWPRRLALVAVALVILPMAPPKLAVLEDGGRLHAAEPTANDEPAATGERSPAPQIVATTPRPGATGVDPGLKEITVTFDRDMRSGMSWTGGPPDFPPIDESRELGWKDKRTCVLPVNLKAGSYYRVGINAQSFQNFRSADGTPAEISAIYFTTQGASSAIEQRVRAPRLARSSPKIGATDVDPATKFLRVTFDMPMGEGMSWVGGGPKFPESPAGQRAKWSKDGMTCSLPVELKPNHEYRLMLNNPSFENFTSKWGVPLEPVEYTFRTRGE